MDLEGDVQQVPGLKFYQNVFVDPVGRVQNVETNSCVKRVVQVIDGTLEDVLHLVGYQYECIENLVKDNILRASDEVNISLKELPQRTPSAYLLQGNGLIYGVIINEKGEARIVGIIRHVIPGTHDDTNYRAVIIAKDASWTFCNPKDINIQEKIEAGAHFGMTSISGSLFLQVKQCRNEEMAELVLVLEKGFFIIEESNIDWIRLKTCLSIGAVEPKITALEKEDCIVSFCGACICKQDGFQLFGSGNAIIRYSAFCEFLREMGNIPNPIPILQVNDAHEDINENAVYEQFNERALNSNQEEGFINESFDFKEEEFEEDYDY